MGKRVFSVFVPIALGVSIAGCATTEEKAARSAKLEAALGSYNMCVLVKSEKLDDGASPVADISLGAINSCVGYKSSYESVLNEDLPEFMRYDPKIVYIRSKHLQEIEKIAFGMSMEHIVDIRKKK